MKTQPFSEEPDRERERERDDRDLDETLAETFPASDPPANTVDTGTHISPARVPQ
jgi:hypothetical protein